VKVHRDKDDRRDLAALSMKMNLEALMGAGMTDSNPRIIDMLLFHAPQVETMVVALLRSLDFKHAMVSEVGDEDELSDKIALANGGSTIEPRMNNIMKKVGAINQILQADTEASMPEDMVAVAITYSMMIQEILDLGRSEENS
jgi:hypothetical protein